MSTEDLWPVGPLPLLRDLPPLSPGAPVHVLPLTPEGEALVAEAHRLAVEGEA